MSKWVQTLVVITCLLVIQYVLSKSSRWNTVLNIVSVLLRIFVILCVVTFIYYKIKKHQEDRKLIDKIKKERKNHKEWETNEFLEKEYPVEIMKKVREEEKQEETFNKMTKAEKKKYKQNQIIWYVVFWVIAIMILVWLVSTIKEVHNHMDEWYSFRQSIWETF